MELLILCGVVASFAAGALVASLYWMDRHDEVWNAGYDQAERDLGHCNRSHVHTLPRPYDHERSGL